MIIGIILIGLVCFIFGIILGISLLDYEIKSLINNKEYMDKLSEFFKNNNE